MVEFSLTFFIFQKRRTDNSATDNSADLKFRQFSQKYTRQFSQFKIQKIQPETIQPVLHNLSELGPSWLTHRVISDRVHRLLVTLSYFRPDRFVQLLSLIPILILLLYYLVSGCLTSLC